MPKPFEIFRPGRQTATCGKVIDFSEEDLRASADAYSPEVQEAPIVIGHPRQADPAYGWVRALSYGAERLMADPHQVNAEFAEMVKRGTFKRVSASFYMPDAPQNPVPGVYYLRHVGFLGASPPAVKGLKPVEFGESEEGVIEFGGWEARTTARLFRGLREWIIGKFGIEEADKVIPGYEVEDLETSAARPEAEPAEIAAYSEPGQAPAKEGTMPVTAEELARKEAELKEREASFAEKEEHIRKQERELRHRAHVSFAEDLVKKGVMVAACKDHAVALLDFAAEIEGQTVEFGEEKASVLDSLKDYMAKQPKAVELGEIAGRETDPGDLSQAGARLDDLTRRKMEERSELSYSAAFAEVQAEHPELVQEYEADFRS